MPTSSIMKHDIIAPTMCHWPGPDRPAEQGGPIFRYFIISLFKSAWLHTTFKKSDFVRGHAVLPYCRLPYSCYKPAEKSRIAVKTAFIFWNGDLPSAPGVFVDMDTCFGAWRGASNRCNGGMAFTHHAAANVTNAQRGPGGQRAPRQAQHHQQQRWQVADHWR